MMYIYVAFSHMKHDIVSKFSYEQDAEGSSPHGCRRTALILEIEQISRVIKGRDLSENIFIDGKFCDKHDFLTNRIR